MTNSNEIREQAFETWNRATMRGSGQRAAFIAGYDAGRESCQQNEENEKEPSTDALS